MALRILQVAAPKKGMRNNQTLNSTDLKLSMSKVFSKRLKESNTKKILILNAHSSQSYSRIKTN